MKTTFDEHGRPSNEQPDDTVTKFDPSEFGFGSAKSGEDNRAALQMAVDRACAGGGVIEIPPNEAYTIAGHIKVAPPPWAPVTITVTGGHATLVQSAATDTIFVLGSENENTPVGRVELSNLWINCAVSRTNSTADNSFRSGTQSAA